MNITERIQLGISYFLRGSLLIAMSRTIITEHWFTLFLTVTIFFLTFLPAIISRNYKVNLPIEFDLIGIIFIYASLYLGEIQSFYLKFWWWDVALHGSSALILGFIGFLVVYILNHQKRLEIHMMPKFVALFSFTFALSIGALWEIFEFTMDQNFGLNMQKSGLHDTMWDLIMDALGAFIASVLGYWYVKRGESFFLQHLIERFVQKNPKIFGRKKKIGFFLRSRRG